MDACWSAKGVVAGVEMKMRVSVFVEPTPKLFDKKFVLFTLGRSRVFRYPRSKHSPSMKNGMDGGVVPGDSFDLGPIISCLEREQIELKLA